MDNVTRGQLHAAVLRAERQAWADGYQSAVNACEKALYGGERELYEWLLSARQESKTPG